MIIIGQISGRESYEAHFEISFEENQEFKKQYYGNREGEVMVISCKDNRSFTTMNYGLIPFWSHQRVLHFESPIEGSENPGAESFKRRIILHPAFRRPIRETRCLIPVDYIILLNELEEPYLIFSTVSKPFALAGIYDSWKRSYQDIAFYYGFSTLTLPSSESFSKVGIERLPLILSPNEYKLWLNPDAHLTSITSLMQPLNNKEINGYPINRKLFLEAKNSEELCKPIGEFLRQDQKQDIGKIANFLKSFRYKRGLTHPQHEQEKRVWRDTR